VKVISHCAAGKMGVAHCKKSRFRRFAPKRVYVDRMENFKSYLL
jgi:hypothetical protein